MIHYRDCFKNHAIHIPGKSLYVEFLFDERINNNTIQSIGKKCENKLYSCSNRSVR